MCTGEPRVAGFNPALLTCSTRWCHVRHRSDRSSDPSSDVCAARLCPCTDRRRTHTAGDLCRTYHPGHLYAGEWQGPCDYKTSAQM